MIEIDELHRIKCLLKKQEMFLGYVDAMNEKHNWFNCRLHVEFDGKFPELHVCYTFKNLEAEKTKEEARLLPEDRIFLSQILCQFQKVLKYNKNLGFEWSSQKYLNKVVVEFRYEEEFKTFLKRAAYVFPSSILRT